MAVFLLTIDTEEEGLWGRQYPRQNHSVDNVLRIPAFQEMLDKFCVRPTYLVSYPVTQNAKAVSILNRILQRGSCEIGAHLHPWCNPPTLEVASLANTFPCNLPPALQRAKLEVLSEAIKGAFGVWPRSYRAGRFGFSGTTLPILEELGYEVDSSVCPLRRWSPGGPNFIRAKATPYFPDYRDVTRPGPSRILEVPLSIGFINPVGQIAERFLSPLVTQLLRMQMVRKLPLLKIFWLRPAIHTLEEMMTLSNTFLQKSIPSLNLMIHSSELLPGATPYHNTLREVELFVSKIEQYINWLTKEFDIIPQTLTEFRSYFCAHSP